MEKHNEIVLRCGGAGTRVASFYKEWHPFIKFTSCLQWPEFRECDMANVLTVMWILI